MRQSTYRLLLISASLLLFINFSFAQLEVYHSITNEQGEPLPYKKVDIHVELWQLHDNLSTPIKIYDEHLSGMTDEYSEIELTIGTQDTMLFNAAYDAQHVLKTYYEGKLLEISCTIYDSIKSEKLIEITELGANDNVTYEIAEAFIIDTLRIESAEIRELILTDASIERMELINSNIEVIALHHTQLNQFYADNITTNEMFIENCKFGPGFSLRSNGLDNAQIDIYESEFNIDLSSNCRIDVTGYDDLTLDRNKFHFVDHPSFEAINSKKKIDSLTIELGTRTGQFLIHLEDCKFLDLLDNTFKDPETGDLKYGYLDIGGNPQSINVLRNDFKVPLSFTFLDIENKLIAKKNKFPAGLAFHQSLLPENYLDFDWAQLSGDIKLFILTEDSVNLSGYPYFGNKLGEFADTDRFRTLIKQYAKFYEHFKKDGDILAANEVYSELQEKHTQRYKYVYQEEGGLRNLFRLRLSQILRTYVNYGTDPAKAIVISFYIVLAFGLFYFFYPSEWDKSSNTLLIEKMRKAFSKHQNSSVGKMLWLLLINFINAFTLSINAFVTLGFGTIPTKGLPRYVCVIQGFLGWFLLSLFSVALINQVLF